MSKNDHWHKEGWKTAVTDTNRRETALSHLVTRKSNKFLDNRDTLAV
jgi:hypothetical protein